MASGQACRCWRPDSPHLLSLCQTALLRSSTAAHGTVDGCLLRSRPQVPALARLQRRACAGCIRAVLTLWPGPLPCPPRQRVRLTAFTLILRCRRALLDGSSTSATPLALRRCCHSRRHCRRCTLAATTLPAFAPCLRAWLLLVQQPWRIILGHSRRLPCSCSGLRIRRPSLHARTLPGGYAWRRRLRRRRRGRKRGGRLPSRCGGAPGEHSCCRRRCGIPRVRPGQGRLLNRLAGRCRRRRGPVCFRRRSSGTVQGLCCRC